MDLPLHMGAGRTSNKPRLQPARRLRPRRLRATASDTAHTIFLQGSKVHAGGTLNAERMHRWQVVISCSDEEFSRLRSRLQGALEDEFSDADWSVEVTSDQHLLEEYNGTLVIDGDDQSSPDVPGNG